MPPSSGAFDNSFEIDGTGDHEQTQARVMLVDQRYFAALRIPLLQGRVWNTDENNRGDFIAVVNQAFATRYLSNSLASSNALGRQLRIPGSHTSESLPGRLCAKHRLASDHRRGRRCAQ